MPTNPTPAGKEPAKGSRETIDKELSDASNKERAAQATARAMMLPGTPRTGEDLCPSVAAPASWGGMLLQLQRFCRVIKGIGRA
jgi:hypothetical protein